MEINNYLGIFKSEFRGCIRNVGESTIIHLTHAGKLVPLFKKNYIIFGHGHLEFSRFVRLVFIFVILSVQAD